MNREEEEEAEILEAKSRNTFDRETKTMDFSKRRATDLKGNSLVIFPHGRILSWKLSLI